MVSAILPQTWVCPRITSQFRGDFNKAKKSLRFIFDKTQIQGNKGVSLIAWRLIP